MVSFEVARSRTGRDARTCTPGTAEDPRSARGRQERRRPSNRGHAKLPSPRRRGLDDGGSGISGTSGPPGTRPDSSANQRKRRPTRYPTIQPSNPSPPIQPQTRIRSTQTALDPPPTFHIRSPTREHQSCSTSRCSLSRRLRLVSTAYRAISTPSNSLPDLAGRRWVTTTASGGHHTRVLSPGATELSASCKQT